MAFTAMHTSNHTLQLLSAVTVIGLIGPACARNYATPRYAFLLVCLRYLPFVAGAASFGNPWMLLMVAQAPPFLFGTMPIIRRSQTLSVAALQA